MQVEEEEESSAGDYSSACGFEDDVLSSSVQFLHTATAV